MLNRQKNVGAIAEIEYSKIWVTMTDVVDTELMFLTKLFRIRERKQHSIL